MNILGTTAVLLVALLGASTDCLAEETSTPAMPDMPGPVKQHEWLQQFVGEWESEAEVMMEPGQPPVESKGVETARMLGGLWMIAEGEGEMPGMPEPMQVVFTLGFDQEKGKYVGTWVDSMFGHMWHYEGSLDADGRRLVLETKGPCPDKPGVIARFKDITEFIDEDHRVLTSLMEGEDGKWSTMVTVHYTRKK